MKRKYIVAAIDSSVFGGFANPFSSFANSVKYIVYEVNGYLEQAHYEKIVNEQWEQNKMCVLSITDVTGKEQENEL